MRKGKLLLGVGLAGLFLWLTLRAVDLAAVAEAGRQVSAASLMLAVMFLAAGYACRVQRWRLMLLRHNTGLGIARVGVPFLASIAVNNLAPFRMGDVMRCFAFSRWLAVPSGAILASVLVERLLDMVTLILALWFFAVSGGAMGFGQYGAAVLAGVGVASGLLLLRPALLRPFAAGLARLVGVASPAVQARVAGFSATLIDALGDLSRSCALGALMLWSLPVWIFEGACYWAVAQGLPAMTAPLAAWLAMPVGTLSTLIPSTPGHVGTFDYFTQAAAVAGGNPVAGAVAFTLIVHLVLWLTTTLTGGVCLAIWALRRGREGQQ